MRFFTTLMVLLVGGSVLATTVEKLQLTTPRGVNIEVVVHYPDSEVPTPAVVIGSGQGYHMYLPLTQGLAEKIADKGYVAIRFNWHYFTQGGEPSENLVNELEDYTTVVKFAKAHSRIDANKIIVAGKSLGTILSYRYFDQDPSVRALILMTPICTWRWDDKDNDLPEPIPVGKKYYPNLLRATRPIVMVKGDRDPLCSNTMLYDFLKSSHENISTVIVEGDHRMHVGNDEDPAYKKRNAENVNAVTDMIAHWVRLIVNRL